MSNINLLAYILMLVGIGLGIGLGGRAGLFWGAVFLFAGWVLKSFGAKVGSSKTLEDTTPSNASAPAPVPPTSYVSEPVRIRVEIKQAYAYAKAKSDGPDESKLDFDVFVHLALLMDAQAEPIVKDCFLRLKMPDGTSTEGERVKGDLRDWRIEGEGEEWDLWDTYTETVGRPEELNTDLPLQRLLPRSGWLHFRGKGISASEFQRGSLEVSVEDSSSRKHAAVIPLLGSLSYPVTAPKVVPRSSPAV